jgi:radical SAM superfamily enzyme YgiQ (UPF0313 family)
MATPIKRILLVWPQFQVSFWGMHYSLHRVNKRAVMAPLALITIAGLLPRDKYEFRHVDLNWQPLRTEDIEWADLVMLSGWGAQYLSIVRVSRKCQKLGKKVLMGGPLATESPDLLRSVDHIFFGEAEGFDLDGLIDDIAAGRAEPRIQGSNLPDISAPHVVPRFDLLQHSEYWQLTVQFGRGCPFTCEFCDIIELYGRVQRTKTADAMIAELESIHALGYRGSVVFVDDNFYSNKKNIHAILPPLIEFQQRHGYPFSFHTEATVNIAKSADLLELMRAAGFYSLFTGIETPHSDSLAETRKVQNLKIDLVGAIREIQAHEIYVQAGFIMGFDSDPVNIGDIIVDYIEATGITVAMTGMLLAMPHTQLERRLIAEGRITEAASIDQFGLPNFITHGHPRELLSGYDRLIARSFSSEALDGRRARQEQIFDHARAEKAAVAIGELRYFAEHLHLYGERVREDLARLAASPRFAEHVAAHEAYWQQPRTQPSPAGATVAPLVYSRTS